MTYSMIDLIITFNVTVVAKATSHVQYYYSFCHTYFNSTNLSKRLELPKKCHYIPNEDSIAQLIELLMSVGSFSSL